ncbi:hypothetical protein [Halobaculum gomorrense]|uniref:Uncharacterized protein n=1 Tax=Halobaculum gomorrense TaxID=43928 RepID=A0A1M5MKY1_9EURY|nr:hypothetical protein [Halobaculum gomorrense]SHG78094.1 hypothetical protein SAMN05443636_1054 [Halobaculum gomorrense]
MTDDNTTGLLSRITPNSLKGALLAGLLLLSVAAGGVVAATELADKTVSVNDDTERVYLEVTNTSSENLNYTVYGIADGITTQEYSGQISAAANDTTRKEFAVNATTYDSYRVVVTENANLSGNETAETIEIGTTVSQSATNDSSGGAIFGGGGGGLLTPLNILLGVLAVAAGWLVGLFDPIKKRITG